MPLEVSRAAARSYVREVIAGVIDTSVEALKAPDALRDLSMDSLTRLNITLRFEHDLGELPPTLMFEHLTIEELVDHFLREHGRKLRELVPETHDLPITAPQVHDMPLPEDGEIAVIAVSGRYPGASDVDSLWRNLRDGLSTVTEVPASRWDWREHFDDRRGQPNKSYGRWGGFIDGVADFDPDFFGILPSDAANMDPQERLFLLTCWNLLEGAGYVGTSTHEPSTGVFVGSMYSTYGKLGATEWPKGKLTGATSTPWSIANRVSYTFDFHGPSFAVDSACSSSLTAVHLACESLRRGECAAAIAGGVNLILHPAHLAGLSATGMLAGDSACKVFDESADGYVPGEGVGAVLLKPLTAAIRDNDHVWAVIKSSALNTAGRTSGFTVPNPAAQSDLVSAALRRAGVEPRTVSYVEAHGTGTKLGDPLEIIGLARAITTDRPENEPCAVGSIKANIGHLEGAAGIAGLTKILLQLKHRQIAPCVRLDTINPKIEAVAANLRFPSSLTVWEGAPLRAGVSSFGAGGSNAHLIVEEFVPVVEDVVEQRGDEHAVLLSARTDEQLRALAAAVAGQLADVPDLARLAYTTQVGRKEMRERLAVIAGDIADVRIALEDFAARKQNTHTSTGSADGFEAGDDDHAYIATLIRKRQTAKLAKLWVTGMPVDWQRLWIGRRPKRVSLPTYPFALRRFWAPAAPEARSSAPVPVAPLLPAPAAVRPNGVAEKDELSAVEWDLRMAACGFLLVDPSEVAVDIDLMQLGFDSISLVNMMGEVGETYGIDLEPSLVFDHPTLRDISRFLLAEHPVAVAERIERG